MPRYRFNRISVSAMAELRAFVVAPIVDGHDVCPSWESISKETEAEARRTLLRCTTDGGLAWLHLDEKGQATDAIRIDDPEAREIWPRVILQFTEQEKSGLEKALKTNTIFEEALKDALGFRRATRSIFLKNRPQDDGTTMRQCLVRNGGIVRAWVDDSDRIARATLIMGDEAWSLIHHFIDP